MNFITLIFSVFFASINSGLLLPLVGFGVVACSWRLAYFLLMGGKYNNE